MRIRAVQSLCAVVGALVLASCGGSPPAGTSSGSDATGSSPRPMTTTTSPGILGPSDCTRSVTTTAELVPLGVAPHDLAAATLAPELLGATSPGWSPGVAFHDGYQENEELADSGYGGTGGCAQLRATGRLLGYTAGTTDEAGSNVRSSATVFLDEAGAAAYIEAAPKLMPVGSAPSPDRPQDVVRSVDVTRPGQLGPDALRVQTDVTGWTVDSTLFRSGNVVGEVTFVMVGGEKPPVDPEATIASAYRVLLSARGGDGPLDAVALLSATLPLSVFGTDYADLQPNLVWGGCATIDELAEYTDDTNFVEHAGALGLFDSCRRMFDESSGVRRVMSSLTTFATPAGTKTSFVDYTSIGDPETFAVSGIPGAVGVRRDVHGDQSFTDTRVLFRVGDRTIATVFVHDVVGLDRRDVVIAAAVELQRRAEAVVAATS